MKTRLPEAPEDALGSVETMGVVEYDVRLSKVPEGQETERADDKEEPPASRGGA